MPRPRPRWISAADGYSGEWSDPTTVPKRPLRTVRSRRLAGGSRSARPGRAAWIGSAAADAILRSPRQQMVEPPAVGVGQHRRRDEVAVLEVLVALRLAPAIPRHDVVGVEEDVARVGVIPASGGQCIVTPLWACRAQIGGDPLGPGEGAQVADRRVQPSSDLEELRAVALLTPPARASRTVSRSSASCSIGRPIRSLPERPWPRESTVMTVKDLLNSGTFLWKKRSFLVQPWTRTRVRPDPCFS